jgi:exodeoxyribonuclease V alpha subunit
MTRLFRAALDLPGLDEGPGGSPWFAGRPVLVLNNDYVLKLFNGDIGIALPDASGQLLVHFPDTSADGGFRAIAPVRMPRHETAFAMTVHKSQGSEFDRVLVMLPEQRSRVLTRELLYTAITRARSRVTLVAGAPVLEEAIATSTERHSGLLTRLAECAAAARDA